MEALRQYGWEVVGNIARKGEVAIRDDRPEYGNSFGYLRVTTSDGGQFDDPGAAAAHASRIANGGGQN